LEAVMVDLPPFQALLDDHAADLARFVRALVGPSDADDVFQDTVVSALRAYPSLRHADNLRGWLFTIAHRKVIDRARKRARAPVELALVTGGPGTPGAPRPPRTVVAEPATNDAEWTEPDPALWEAVRRLPPRQRDCLVARFVLDLPYREVGELVGCSDVAARQNVREALHKLQEELTDG
jgi:RNA polymerase sigma factor (sigma-70 family)